MLTAMVFVDVASLMWLLSWKQLIANVTTTIGKKNTTHTDLKAHHSWKRDVGDLEWDCEVWAQGLHLFHLKATCMSNDCKINYGHEVSHLVGMKSKHGPGLFNHHKMTPVLG